MVFAKSHNPGPGWCATRVGLRGFISCFIVSVVAYSGLKLPRKKFTIFNFCKTDYTLFQKEIEKIESGPSLKL